MLKLINVTKKFGKIVALEDVTFDVKEGEFVFLTGPSGAGKTTLIRLILRELLPDDGEILLADEDITRLPPKKVPYLRQQIGVVFQDFKVLPEKTLWENIEVALAVVNVPYKEWRARVKNVLKLVDLKERANLFPSQLSGGELQRASLARALVVNPKVILADEPTGNLDWNTAEMVMNLFDTINKEGKTIIAATHHLGLVEKLNKRVIELKDGKVVDNKKGAKSNTKDKESNKKETVNVEVTSKKKKPKNKG